jgi:hypothetical protein
MTRRSKVWLAVAVIFTLINVGGAVIAALDGELLHALGHVVLVPIGMYAVWRLFPRRSARRIGREGDSVIAGPPGEFTDRLTRLEQSLDAVAIEVDRVGEGQRFMTNLLAEEEPPPPAAEGAPKPNERKER